MQIQQSKPQKPIFMKMGKDQVHMCEYNTHQKWFDLSMDINTTATLHFVYKFAMLQVYTKLVLTTKSSVNSQEMGQCLNMSIAHYSGSSEVGDREEPCNR